MKLWQFITLFVVITVFCGCSIGMFAYAATQTPLTIDDIAEIALSEVYNDTNDKYYHIIELKETTKSNSTTYLLTVYYENINSRTVYEDRWCVEVLDKQTIIDIDLLTKEAYEYGRRTQSN